LEFGLPQDFVKPKKILLKAVNAYVNEKSWMLKSVLTSLSTKEGNLLLNILSILIILIEFS
jgi:hypothetical protein